MAGLPFVLSGLSQFNPASPQRQYNTSPGIPGTPPIGGFNASPSLQPLSYPTGQPNPTTTAGPVLSRSAGMVINLGKLSLPGQSNQMIQPFQPMTAVATTPVPFHNQLQPPIFPAFPTPPIAPASPIAIFNLGQQNGPIYPVHTPVQLSYRTF